MSFFDWFSNERGFDRNKAGKEFRWRGYLPLDVYCDGPTFLHLYGILAGATAEWNRVVNRRLFMHPIRGEDETISKMMLAKGGGIRGAILIRLDVHHDDPKHGHTIRHADERTGELWNCVVTLRPEPQYSVLMHELGHCLGLAHDLHPSSIMFANIVDRPQTVTKADAERLRKAYGKFAPKMPERA